MTAIVALFLFLLLSYLFLRWMTRVFERIEKDEQERRL